MNAEPMTNGVPGVPETGRRGKGGSSVRRIYAALGAKELAMHAELKGDGRLKSGRNGGYVYYVREGRQCWRRNVVPRDPRTPGQRRSRLAFAAASKGWSQNGRLTEEQRAGWRAEGAKVHSHPRLGQSGPLTGPQRFVGRNSVKERYGMALLLELPKRERQMEEGGAQKAEPPTQLGRLEGVEESTSGTGRAGAPPEPSQGQVTQKVCRQRPERGGRGAQGQRYGGGMGAVRGGSHNSLASGYLCRWGRGMPRGNGIFGSLAGSPRRGQARRKGHYRELWRGG
jgi:hypothetical protein